MKKNRIFALLLAALTATAALAGCQSEPESLTPEQKQSDFDTLTTILDEAYPFWQDVAAAGIDKDEIYERYEAIALDSDSTTDYLTALYRMLSQFGGAGHLGGVGGSGYASYLDLYSSILEEYKEAYPEAADLISPQVEVLESPVTVETYSKLDPEYSGFRPKKRGLFSLIDAIGREQTASAEPESLLETDILDDGTAYMKIPSFHNDYRAADGERIAAFFEEIRDTENLIIDIRGNGGGNTAYWQDFIVRPNAKEDLHVESYYLYKANDWTYDYVTDGGQRPLSEVSKLPDSIDPQDFTHFFVEAYDYPAAEDPYPGDIWVLMDEYNYSASESFLMLCKQSGFATLVGTSSSGGDNPSSDPMFFSLPESGFVFRMSTTYCVNPDGTSNERYGTAPDILVKPTEDPLEAVLQKIAERS